ncbi:ras-related protein Rab-43 isoform X3 [Trachemys scripta elegans]|uniref:ras-related protein Rab-43 isoform X3 n=1 Tax=Trachemys scripta elegans TaxID=31138 RepID=UPI000388E7B7|nr:ras-related protein Rab-43 isoform X3 [Chrysemys picta bellii]XP_034631642.1 ras-related protein Rab-43 isoform X3 [Trachemys scripta elegans]XP_039403529.1 ras-related protein Rab-43 isoform X3 [Mauremys reevesii]
MPGPPTLGAAGPGPDPEERYDFLFKLVLIGDASVGKTCLVQRFKTGAFAERQGSTIGVDFTMKSLEIQVADLGHSRPGEIPNHHTELLPKRQWSNPSLRHQQEKLFPVHSSLD